MELIWKPKCFYFQYYAMRFEAWMQTNVPMLGYYSVGEENWRRNTKLWKKTSTLTNPYPKV
jgi:hypothetical protein